MSRERRRWRRAWRGHLHAELFPDPQANADSDKASQAEANAHEDRDRVPSTQALDSGDAATARNDIPARYTELLSLNVDEPVRQTGVWHA